MKKLYIKPESKVYNIIPKKYAIGLPITSEEDDDSKQARRYNDNSLIETDLDIKKSTNDPWKEWE